MAHISRESTAPIRNGEGIAADDVELEFQKIFSVIGQSGSGDLDTSNFSRNANIAGGQIANTTLVDGNFSADTVTTSSINATAVTKAAFSVADVSGQLTTSASLVDVSGVASLTLTPGSTSDIVQMTASLTLEKYTGGDPAAAGSAYSLGFNIDDGTGDVEVGHIEFGGAFLDLGADRTVHMNYVMTATAATETTYKLVHKRLSGSGTGQWQDAFNLDYNAVFYVVVYPIK